MTVEITFVRESIEGDKQITATFLITPEIMADVSAYDQRELLVILFNYVANFLSVGSGWRFDSVQSLAISLCQVRPTVGARSYIQTPKSLHSKGVLNIQNLKDDYYFLWSILGHIHRVDKHADELYNYKKYFNELDITGFNFYLKFSDTPKFEKLNSSISINTMKSFHSTLLSTVIGNISPCG